MKISLTVLDKRGTELPVKITKVVRWGRQVVVRAREVSPIVQRVEGLTLLEQAERKVIDKVLRTMRGNKNRTRIALDITVNTLNAKLKKYGIVYRGKP